MLKIQHSYHLPHLLPAHQKLALSRAAPDSDELIQSIDSENSDDQWTLDDGPDGAKLGAFWEGVEQDIAKDPEWFTFSDD